MEKLGEKFREKYIDNLFGSPGELANLWHRDVILKNNFISNVS